MSFPHRDRPAAGLQGGLGRAAGDRCILDSRELPDESFLALWQAIVVESTLKDRLLAQAILNFTLRPKVDRAALPLHGIILLVGAPGTGKTSLAKGLAARTAEALPASGLFRYLEVEPHGLASAALGRSQRAVTELLGSTIAEEAQMGPLIVLLDEVETLAASRSRMSLEANPVDVHRATDAVLAQLDLLAIQFPQLLFLATSNFPEAVDAAFVSRADLVATFDLPDPEACRAILSAAVLGLARAYPQVEHLLSEPEFAEAARLCHGLDGRRIRKLVVAACALDKETAMDPSRLRARDLVRAAQLERQAASAVGGKR